MKLFCGLKWPLRPWVKIKTKKKFVRHHQLSSSGSEGLRLQAYTGSTDIYLNQSFNSLLISVQVCSVSYHPPIFV